MTKGLYLHIPFCEKKCNYCDFYSVANASLRNKYVNSLCEYIKKWGRLTTCPINTLYLGGGTPSLLSYSELDQIVKTVKEYFTLTENSEITVEINPDDRDFLEYAVKCSVNRISVGVQSADDHELKVLGRRHSFDDVKKTVLLARKLGITNLSLDLMLGLPNSSRETLNKSIREILALNPEHISAYILKVEPNTPFGKENILLPDDDEVADQYLFMCDTLEKAGYLHYEISNFAKKGYYSQHNSNYWQDGEYIGIGPAAHSFLDGKRFYYPSDINSFISGTDPVFDGMGGSAEEFIMLALRLKRGLVFSEFEKRYGALPDSVIKKAKLYKGLCNVTDNSISLTDKGMLLSNSIIAELTEVL